MTSKINWAGGESQSQGDPWLGTPLGGGGGLASDPFTFLAAPPAPVKRARVQWLGEVGLAGASGLSVPQLKETESYKSCVAISLNNCPKAVLDGSFKGTLAECFESTSQVCLQLADQDEAAKKSGGAASQTPAQITALQTNINKRLTELGICNIGIDGKIGPTTCAAAKYTVGATGVYTPGICATKTGSGSFDPNCKLGQKQGPPVSPCALCKADEDCVDEKCVPKCPAGQARGTDGKCAPAQKTAAGGETPWGLFALGAAAVGAIGLVFLKAPKMPAREAERMPEDNPKRRKKSRRRAA